MFCKLLTLFNDLMVSGRGWSLHLTLALPITLLCSPGTKSFITCYFLQVGTLQQPTAIFS